MNAYQTKLYNDLLALTKSHEAFMLSDQTKGQKVYRIFSYRLASYGDFCEPSALECRGIMFELDRTTMEPIRLAAMPFEKFFNLNENPFTMDVNFGEVKHVYTKVDGSLISTFLHTDADGFEGVACKSKASLWSLQAVEAEEFIRKDENIELYDAILELSLLGLTVNLEWVAPHNRIVLGYDRPNLIILSIRDMDDGSYVYPDHFSSPLLRATLEKHWVADRVKAVMSADVQAFVNAIPAMEGIEGFVLVLNNEQKVKIKTEWYLTRHRLKDSVANPRHLFEAIVTEAIDDIKAMFVGDDITLNTIKAMEDMTIPLYNRMIATVEKFYAENKGLERKEYAIKAQSLNDNLMSLYMNLYLTRPNNYPEFAVKHSEMFGVYPLRPNNLQTNE